MNEKLSELLNSGFNEYGKRKDALMSFLSDFAVPVSLDECSAIFSKDIDELIVKQKKDGNIFIGGVFSYVAVDDKHFKVAYELYMQNPKHKYIRHRGESDLIELTRLIQKDRELLSEKKKLDFEIDEPTEKVECSERKGDTINEAENFEDTEGDKGRNEDKKKSMGDFFSMMESLLRRR